MSASILIVDDEVSILNSLSSILEDEGYEVSVAKSGIEALKLCTVNPPELMMLDGCQRVLDLMGNPLRDFPPCRRFLRLDQF